MDTGLEREVFDLNEGQKSFRSNPYKLPDLEHAARLGYP
jgi:hypothetical protein